ncbi:MAG: Gfo/Idh/MocA family oxidoreductase [Bacteroidota bacterium]|nr:Gfo/Idh/MocA family oxidoreductase [Bacteroidota bacterium]
MQSLRWGIVGPGNIARDFVRDLALVTPVQEVVAAFGHHADSTHAFCREFFIEKACSTLAAFTNDTNIDIAYIATPHPFHYEQALACLQKGIHVLCEKPMTINADQCKALIEASAANDCFLMEAMWIRFLPSIRKLLALLRDDAIGEVLSVKAYMGFRAPKDQGSRYFNPELGGGSLLDLGIYPVFLAHLLLGKPSLIKAFGTLGKTGVDETCAALFGYENRRHAIIESSLLSPSGQPAEVAGTKGVIKLQNPWFEKCPGIEWQRYNEEKQFYPLDWEGHGLQFEVMEVLRCIAHGQIESEYFAHSFSLNICETMDEIRAQIGLSYPRE